MRPTFHSSQHRPGLDSAQHAREVSVPVGSWPRPHLDTPAWGVSPLRWASAETPPRPEFTVCRTLIVSSRSFRSCFLLISHELAQDSFIFAHNFNSDTLAFIGPDILGAITLHPQRRCYFYFSDLSMMKSSSIIMCSSLLLVSLGLSACFCPNFWNRKMNAFVLF